jgi:uncharacterized protein (UPF0548 family)
MQFPEDGAGPLFHRTYSARIRDARMTPEELVDRLASDLNKVAPSEFARFEKVLGAEATLVVGDEYVVRMPGPWDGPVRVVDRTSTSFRLATLEGHLEAGQIEFRAGANKMLEFEIESWARSGDRFSDLLYDRMRMSKEVQLHMWTSVIERVTRLSGGRLTGGIDIRTRRVRASGDTYHRPLGDPSARKALDALHDRSVNFTAEDRHGLTAKNGWIVDDYCQELPGEAPGPPRAGGSWEAARDLMRRYEFADPAIVRTVYYPDRPLDGRDMLLELRFYGLRFHAGVRVGGVIDETRTVDGREARVFGWNYRTLHGHLEMGQMDYQVWKWLDSGEVEFRIHVVSRPARIPNLIVRLGFRLFGRREQIRFARRACERMATLTAAAIAGATEPALPPAADEMTVQPASEAGGLRN